MADRMQGRAHGGCREDRRAWAAGCRRGRARDVDTGRRWSWTGGGEAWGRGRAQGHGGSRGGRDDARRGGCPAWQSEMRG